MRDYTLPATQPPLGTPLIQGANHPAPANHLPPTGEASPPARTQTLPTGRDSGSDNMGTAGTSGGLAAARGFGERETPTAGVGGTSAARRDSGSESTEAARRSRGSSAGRNLITTGSPQVRSGNSGHQTLVLVWKSKQGNGPWMDWDDSQDWYNPNGYLRVAMANQAKTFPDPPIPDTGNKEISICSPGKNLAHNCKPVSGFWVYKPEETLLERNRQRIRRPEPSSERLSVFRLDIQLGPPEKHGDKIGKLEHDLLKQGCWIVIRGPTPNGLSGPELLLAAAEQLPAAERRPPRSEHSNVRTTRLQQKKQRVERPAAREKVVGEDPRGYSGRTG